MPEKYELQLERKAERALRRLPPASYRHVESALDRLTEDPRPRGTLKLEGSPFYRLRVGEYRVIYALFDPDRLIKVVDVERRTSQSYKRLP